ncbi:MAG: hypothetical protein J6Y91_04805 [Alphaproteobacteria bacterium]|nr:hypothetical protein [Alphaproteobacteria bacterium]
MISLCSCVYDFENDTDYSVKDNSQDVIIFLHSPTCSKSTAAKNYIDATYHSVRIRYIDIDLEGNRYFLKAAKQDYPLDSDGDGFIDTPVICFGDNYIEGWSYEKRKTLDDYILRYIPSE